MRDSRWIFIAALVAAAAVSGCKQEQVAQNVPQQQKMLSMPSGTSISVTLGTSLSSEFAAAGTSWNGAVLNGVEGIPSGSSVSGTVTSATPARKGDRAMLDLGLTAITVGGHRYAVHGSTESIIAGSTRARNLGAIAGGAAVGALVGNAIGHSSKGTIIGAVVGGGAATGVVASTDGYQVVLKPGTTLTFTTSEAVAVRQ